MKKIIGAVRLWLASRKNLKDPTKEDATEGYKSLHIQPTPNPQACQFVVNQPVVDHGSIHYDSADEAQDDPFAKAVFGIFGIETVFLKENFVTIAKSPVVSWDAVAPQIEEAIETRLTFYETQKEETREPAQAGQDEFKEFTPEEFLRFSEAQKKKIIEAIFDCAIRPALARDGGDLDLIAVQGNTIQVHFQGACGACPSSTRGTLQFIEGMIKENLHPELKVEAQ